MPEMRIRIIITLPFLSTCLVVILFALVASVYATGLDAKDDNFETTEDTIVEGNVLADNGNGQDEGSGMQPLTIIAVNGTDQVGQEITLEDPNALLTISASGALTYKPAGQFEALAQGQSDTHSFTYTISDGQSQTDTATVMVTINGINDAPDLEDGGEPDYSFPSVTVDDDGSGSEVTVSTILGTRFSDVDNNALAGIALTQTSGNGIWQYSPDGVIWSDIGSVSNSQALALEDDDTIRYVPDGSNTETAGVTFRAWDRTSGSAGNKLDAGINGDTTSFSEATNTASLNITSSLDPVLEGLVSSTTIHENDEPSIIDSDVTLLDPASAGFGGGKLTTTFSAEGLLDINTGTLSPFTLSGVQILHSGTAIGEITEFTETGGEMAFFAGATRQIIEELIENLTYEVVSDDPTTPHTLTITITNSLGGSTGEHSVTINIVPENDPPVAVSDVYEVVKGGTLVVTATDSVLANDSDPDSTGLTAVLVDMPGYDPAFTLSESGTFMYHHDNSDTTADTFTYRASDGELDSGTPTTVTVNIISPPVVTSPVSSQIEKNSAKLGATVESDGGSATNETGIVWTDTATNPGSFSYSGTATSSTAQTGAFTVSLTGLSPDTVYYYRGYARNNAGISYTEESQFRTIKGYDYGDSPSTYPKAWHKVTTGGLYLGYKVDVESNHQPDSDAMGDDSHGVDDEDGITFHSDTLTPGSVFGGVITISDAGYLNAWIDFNRDGDWDDEYEHVMDNESITSTNATFSWPVYTIGKGKTYARFRFSSQTGLGPGGSAEDGEVEDYCLTLAGTDPVDDEGLSNVSVSSTVNEGSMATLTGNAGCAGTLNIGWGDGSSPETFSLDAGAFSQTHEYADGPINDCIIDMEFIDCNNESHIKSKTIQVKNVRPTIDVSGPATIRAGSPCTITLGNVVDPGSDMVSKYIVDWGDGSSDQYNDGGDKSHTFNTIGDYTISIELRDEDGNHPGAGTHTLKVNDNDGSNGTSDTDNESNDSNGTSDDNGEGDDTGTGDDDGNTGGGRSSPRSGGGSSRIGGSSDSPSISGYSSEDDYEPIEDSGGGGVPLWLILVPIFGVLIVGIGLYYYLGNAFEWW